MEEAVSQWTLRRKEVVARLLHERGDLLVVSGLGAPSYDVATAGDHPLNFYLWGAMGGAALLGLGLALAQPTRRVLVITGDGEQLMGMGGLATIAVQRPHNLAIVVLDNERYGETGQQLTHTAHGVDLAAVAHACGFACALTVQQVEELDALRDLIQQGHGPLFAVVKVAPTPDAMDVLPPRDGHYLKQRFREALLGTHDQ
jgi:thiamine pyrophosphate-dependent acetolactate synthase large subunit-like protein